MRGWLLPFAVAALLVPQGAAQAQTDTRGWNPMTFTKPTEAELKQKLTPEQYSVTQQDATERPFHNAYWDNHEAGIYVDVVSGRAAVQLARQVRLGHRLAQLHPAAGAARTSPPTRTASS